MVEWRVNCELGRGGRVSFVRPRLVVTGLVS